MGTKLTDKNRLSLVCSYLVKEWDSEKNFPSLPEHFSYKSHYKAFWKCCVCEYEWQAVVYSRTSGKGCRACAGQVVTDLNRLSILYPHLVEEWDREKNFPLTPDDVSKGSNKKVGWKCPVCGYRWFAYIYNRAKGENGCAGCAGQVVTDLNRLSLIHPHLVKEWDSEKNFPTIPDDVSYGSGEEFGWVCKVCGWKWISTINNRTNKTRTRGCRNCSVGPVSKISQEWLDIKGVSKEFREFTIFCGDKKFIVDGFDPITNTVYEFLGDYWHGNPNNKDMSEIHPSMQKKRITFGQLFDETVERLFLLLQYGYNLEIIWEADFYSKG